MFRVLIERIFPSIRAAREAKEYEQAVQKWNEENANWGFLPKSVTASAPNSFVFGPNERGVSR